MPCCYRLYTKLTYTMTHPTNFCLLDCGVPAKTSLILLSAIMRRLDNICSKKFELIGPNTCASPKAIAMFSAFTNSTVGSWISDQQVWHKALKDDPTTNLLLGIVANPRLSTSSEHSNKLCSVYHHPDWQGHFTIEHGILCIKEIFKNDVKYIKLRIVPSSLQNIIFIIFYSNPIGGHLDAFQTFHRIHQRYFCPGVYSYCKHIIKAFPGCSLSNLNKARSADLVYSLPI